MKGHFQLDKTKSMAASLTGFTAWIPCDPSFDPWHGSQIFWVCKFALSPAVDSCIDLCVSNDHKAEKANLKSRTVQSSKYAEPECKTIQSIIGYYVVS